MSSIQTRASVTDEVFVTTTSVTYAAEEEEVMIKVTGHGDETNKKNGKKTGKTDNTNKKKN